MAIQAARSEAAGTDVNVPPLSLDQCDEAVLASALATPQAGFGGHEQYPDMPSKTAVLLYALAKSQACADGNKRIALILVIEFLALNGWTLDITEDDLAELILHAAASLAAQRDVTVSGITEELRPRIVPYTEAQ